jgi:malonate transporter and related proteins
MNYAPLLLPDFMLIVLGYGVCRYTPLNRPLWEKVEMLVYFLLFPVLLFQSIVRRPIDVAASVDLVTIALILAACTISLSHALGYVPGMDRKQHTGAAQVGFRFNSFIALAVSERLAGAAGVQQMAILMGVSVPLYNAAAVWMMSRNTQQNFLLAIAKNPLVIATFGGLCANLLGFQIPNWADSSVSRIGQAALALGLMAAGAGMQLVQLGQTPLLSLGVLSVRHFIAPLIAAGLLGIFKLPPAQALIVMAFSALPTASNAYILAARMGYNGAYVAALVTTSTLLGMVSLPFALSVLGRF